MFDASRTFRKMIEKDILVAEKRLLIASYESWRKPSRATPASRRSSIFFAPRRIALV